MLRYVDPLGESSAMSRSALLRKRGQMERVREALLKLGTAKGMLCLGEEQEGI